MANMRPHVIYFEESSRLLNQSEVNILLVPKDVVQIVHVCNLQHYAQAVRIFPGAQMWAYLFAVRAVAWYFELD